MRSTLVRGLQDSLAVKQAILANEQLLELTEAISQLLIDCFRADGKVLWCGNGGSAADAQHLAAELSGRYYFDRPPLFAEALHVNTSYLTAVGNDYGYDAVFSRMVEGAGRAGDVLIAMSTSGRSPNVLAAARAAKTQGMQVVAMTGEQSRDLGELADYTIAIPSADTPRIQEGHMLLGHLICEIVEATIFGGSRVY